jgi:hypothetical protein
VIPPLRNVIAAIATTAIRAMISPYSIFGAAG